MYHVATDGQLVAASLTKTAPGTHETVLHTLSAAAGQELWTRRLSADSEARFVAFGRGVVFLGTSEGQSGEILALEGLSGSVLWRLRVREPLFDGSTIPVGDWLFVNTSGTATAYDARTGQARWTRRYTP